MGTDMYIFLSESYISSIHFSSRVSLITVSPAMPYTISNSSCHGVLYPRYYGLVGTFSCKTAPARGTREVVLLSPRVWRGCHCLGTRGWYLMHYSNPFVTGGQKHTHHIQHIITNAICQWLIPQQHNKTTPPMVSQRLHPAAPLLPPYCQPLPSLAAHCLPLAAQCWCWPSPPDTWSVIQL